MKIRTVCGDIAPEELGFTLIHEHLIQDIAPAIGDMRPMFPDVTDDRLTLCMKNLPFLQRGGWMLSRECMDVRGDDYLDFIIGEAKAYRAEGGKSMCECSIYGLLGRPHEDLKRISEAAGVHVVCGVGIYAEHTRPAEFRGMGEDELKRSFESVIDRGFGDSGVRPGFVKATISGLTEDGGLIPGELDVYRACARISAERDMPMQVHISTPPLTAGQIADLAELAKRLGANPGRINFCHMNCLVTTFETMAEHIKTHQSKYDVDAYKKIFDTGINLSFDSFGNPVCGSSELTGGYRAEEYTFLSALYELIQQGYADQIMLGHDFTCRISGSAYGGYGYTRVPNFVCKMLEELDCGAAVQKMTLANPARFLSY